MALSCRLIAFPDANPSLRGHVRTDAGQRVTRALHSRDAGERQPGQAGVAMGAASLVVVSTADSASVSIPAVTDLPTPLEEAPPELSGGRPLYLKREDVHELGAFKWRGALPSLEKYRAGGADAVVTASTGNHGAATAWAAERTGMRAVVFVPEGASAAKVALLEDLGAELHSVGEGPGRVEGTGPRARRRERPAVLRGRRRAGAVRRLRGDRQGDPASSWASGPAASSSRLATAH